MQNREQPIQAVSEEKRKPIGKYYQCAAVALPSRGGCLVVSRFFRRVARSVWTWASVRGHGAARGAVNRLAR
jgi:hypothetical protein